MTPERRQRLGELFDAALELGAADREPFLDDACADDPSLRAEVLSLLAAHERAGSFLEAPALPADAVPETPAPLPGGAHLGPYEVLTPLGAGGMGEVYRARDPRLGRDVAVKVLRCGADDPGEPRRLEREARSVAALNHPNIVTVYDVGVEQGLAYMVSELLEGMTLRACLRSGALPLPQCLDCARQILAGLAAAHDKGVVHRDLKPENLFLTCDRRVKILDFGIAKQVPGLRAGAESGAGPASQTQPGTVLGTVGYMSPEQVRGRPADARSDLFSFGAVLYEMLAGRRAFTGDSPIEMMSAILTQEPASLGAARREVSAALERLVLRCLRKEPVDRFASAQEVLFALEAASAPAVETSAPMDRRGKSVAVLPFRDLARDPANAGLGLGLADATITELALVRSLLVRPTSTILGYEDRHVDPQTAGRELAVDAVVEGSFQRAGSGLRVTVQLVSTADGQSLWGSKIDAALDDLFRMQDRVSRAIADALAVEITESDERRRQRRGRAVSANGDAYPRYLRGRAQLLRSTLSDCIAAVDCFEKAREADPEFALAWAGLAVAYHRIAFTFLPEGDWYARGQAMCKKALELDPELPEARYARARLRWSPRGGWDHGGSLRDLAAALAGRSSQDEARYLLGCILLHVGLVDEADVELERALALSPQNGSARIDLGLCRYHQGHYSEALAILAGIARAAPLSVERYNAALCHLRLGHLDKAARIAEVMEHHEPDEVMVHPIRGLIAGVRKDKQAAQEQMRMTIEKQKAFGHYHHAQYDLACIHALVGELEEALAALRDAAQNGYPCVTFFERDPFLISLRGHPGFEALLAELRFERDGYRRLYRDLLGTDSTW